MNESREQPHFTCEGCRWHETEYSPVTPFGDEEYDSYCSAGMDDCVFDAYENDIESEPCPLRAALEERDEWKAKAKLYRARAASYECDLGRNEGECDCFSEAPE